MTDFRCPHCHDRMPLRYADGHLYVCAFASRIERRIIATELRRMGFE